MFSRKGALNQILQGRVILRRELEWEEAGERAGKSDERRPIQGQRMGRISRLGVPGVWGVMGAEAGEGEGPDPGRPDLLWIMGVYREGSGR